MFSEWLPCFCGIAVCSRRAEADEAKAKKEKAAKAAELPTSMDHEVAIPHELARKWHERAREGT